MPKYFFHLIHPERDPVRDDEGVTFENDAVARREAILSLGELIKESGSSQQMPYCVSVQVVREGVGIIDLLTGHLSDATRPGSRQS